MRYVILLVFSFKAVIAICQLTPTERIRFAESIKLKSTYNTGVRGLAIATMTRSYPNLQLSEILEKLQIMGYNPLVFEKFTRQIIFDQNGYKEASSMALYALCNDMVLSRKIYSEIFTKYSKILLAKQKVLKEESLRQEQAEKQEQKQAENEALITQKLEIENERKKEHELNLFLTKITDSTFDLNNYPKHNLLLKLLAIDTISKMLKTPFVDLNKDSILQTENYFLEFEKEYELSLTASAHLSNPIYFFSFIPLIKTKEIDTLKGYLVTPSKPRYYFFKTFQGSTDELKEALTFRVNDTLFVDVKANSTSEISIYQNQGVCCLKFDWTYNVPKIYFKDNKQNEVLSNHLLAKINEIFKSHNNYNDLINGGKVFFYYNYKQLLHKNEVDLSLITKSDKSFKQIEKAFKDQ